MKDLQRLANRAMRELDAIGVPYNGGVEFSVNTRAKSRWGQCRRISGNYYIDINVELLDDNIGDEGALDTIIHELIHTCPNCLNHGNEWQRWAELVNDCYGCYHIQRCSSASDKGVDPHAHQMRRKKKVNWKFRCVECNRHWDYQRKPQWLARHGYNPINNIVDSVNCPYCHTATLKIEYGNLHDIPHTYSF